MPQFSYFLEAGAPGTAIAAARSVLAKKGDEDVVFITI
jgi:hypothetical protein